MFISKVRIKGYRNFKDTTIIFDEGVSVIIGPNNSGKSNLIRAMSLVLNSGATGRLNTDDFNKNISLEELKANPPKITISISISQSKDENLYSDDLVTVGSWLVSLESPYEALLTYEYFLPESEIENFKKSIGQITNTNAAWLIFKQDFLRLYIHKVYGGEPSYQITADGEALNKFDFQFLDAIRDVERDMFSGRNSSLKEVLDFFLDYEIKSAPVDLKPKEAKEAEIKTRRQEFSAKSEELIQNLQRRMGEGKKQILAYAKDTGASFNNANPNFEGSLSESELYSALKLIVEYQTGLQIPATHNGLGYNNLIFMSLLLAKMQVNSDGSYLGSNAKVFPLLAIEEPEAHLHPAMQYKFLQFLRENKDVKKKVRQIFVTTHSTHITSAVSLNEIVCLGNTGGTISIGYPGRAFPTDDASKKAKAYVQRFLDATKSDMLFAKKVILVEGIAEQLLISIFCRYLGKSLEDNHIAVINVGGGYFSHFLRLFDTLQANTIPKKIACVTDQDPEKRQKPDGTFGRCYPFEMNQNPNDYEYRNHGSGIALLYSNHPNIRVFTQNKEQGKTFEYDLVFQNPSLKLLVTDSMKNRAEILELMELYKSGKPLSDFEAQMRRSSETTKILNGIAQNLTWSEDDKKRAMIASRFLHSIAKGENALELAYALEENRKKTPPEIFVVPQYIQEAIAWICQ